MKIITIYILIILTSIEFYSQKKDPELILNKVKLQFEKIEDYIVDVKVNVDVKFLKIADRTAKIYYKKPDKLFVESEGFALLPKQGLDFSPIGLLADSYTALYHKEEKLHGINTTVIKIIPLSEKSDIILSTLWIDESRNLILQIESTRKPDGTIKIEFDYFTVNEKYLLPSKMAFTFDVDNVFFPSGVTGEINSEIKDKNKNKENKPGRITIYYSNYSVNQGLEDEIFTNQKKK